VDLTALLQRVVGRPLRTSHVVGEKSEPQRKMLCPSAGKERIKPRRPVARKRRDYGINFIPERGYLPRQRDGL